MTPVYQKRYPQWVAGNDGALRQWELHRSIYVIVTPGALHHLLLAKADISGSALHGAILLLLLGYRYFRTGPERPAEGVAA